MRSCGLPRGPGTNFALLSSLLLCVSEMTFHGRLGSYFLLLTSYFLLLTSYFLLLTSYFLLLTSYFLLLTSYFLLLTSYFLLFISYFFFFSSYFLLLTSYFLLLILASTFSQQRHKSKVVKLLLHKLTLSFCKSDHSLLF